MSETQPRDLTPSCPEPTFAAAPLSLSTRAVEADWIDFNGHMNVAYYTLAFDRALDEFLEDWIGNGWSFVKRARFGPMALQVQICYLGELLEGERFHVDVLLLDHDEKRMHVIASMISERTGGVAATYEVVDICVDLDTRRPAPYQGWVQARLAAMKAAQADLPRPAQTGRGLGLGRRK
ncbi:MAG: thioesterase family protein [Pikeienuella sp.]